MKRMSQASREELTQGVSAELVAELEALLNKGKDSDYAVQEKQGGLSAMSESDADRVLDIDYETKKLMLEIAKQQVKLTENSCGAP